MWNSVSFVPWLLPVVRSRLPTSVIFRRKVRLTERKVRFIVSTALLFLFSLFSLSLSRSTVSYMYMYHKTKLFPHLVFHHTNAVYTDDRTPDVYTKPRTARDKGVCRVYERFSTNYSGFLSSSSFHGPLSSPQNQSPLSQVRPTVSEFK